MSDGEFVPVFSALKTRCRVDERVSRIDSAFLPTLVEKGICSSGKVVSVGVRAAERTTDGVVERWIGASVFLEEAEFVGPSFLQPVTEGG